MRKFALTALAIAIVALSFAVPALADTVSTVATAANSPVQTTTQVGIPIGDWLGGSAEVIIAVAGAFVAWAMRQLPASIVQILKTMQVDQLLTKAIGYGINAVAGAEKGKVLKVDVANEVTAKSLQYVIDHAPGWLVTWMGGVSSIEEKIIARLEVEPAAAVAPVATLVAVAPAPPAEPAPASPPAA